MSDSSATLQTIAHQIPLSMGFSRQEYWSGLPCPPPGDLPDPGIKSTSPVLTGRFFATEPPGKPCKKGHYCNMYMDCVTDNDSVKFLGVKRELDRKENVLRTEHDIFLQLAFVVLGAGSQGGTFCREREQGERRRKQMWQSVTQSKSKPVAFSEDTFVRCFSLYNACVLLFSFSNCEIVVHCLIIWKLWKTLSVIPNSAYGYS